MLAARGAFDLLATPCRRRVVGPRVAHELAGAEETVCVDVVPALPKGRRGVVERLQANRAARLVVRLLLGRLVRGGVVVVLRARGVVLLRPCLVDELSPPVREVLVPGRVVVVGDFVPLAVERVDAPGEPLVVVGPPDADRAANQGGVGALLSLFRFVILLSVAGFA